MAFAKRKNRALNRIMREKRDDLMRKSAAVASSDVCEAVSSQSFDIPTNYGDTYVRTIQRDPATTFVYWEMPENKAADCGIPIRGNVHTQPHRADWIKDRVSAHVEPPAPAPQDNFVHQTQAQAQTQTHTPLHIPQTKEPTFAHEQNFSQGQNVSRDHAQPPSAPHDFAQTAHISHDHSSSQEHAQLNVPIIQKIEPKVIGPTIPSIYENYSQPNFDNNYANNFADDNQNKNIKGINTLSSESTGGWESIQHNMSMQSSQNQLHELTFGTGQQSAYERSRIIANCYEFTFDFIIRDSAQMREHIHNAALSSTMLHSSTTLHVANRGETE